MSSFFYPKILEFLQANSKLLHSSLHGLEKESLRVTSKGELSIKKHPSALGSALMHPHYTLDFAESQLEFVTSPYNNIEKAYNELVELHQFAYKNLGSELLWNYSSPCPVEDEEKIALACFGMTKKGYEKWLYRSGVSLRCGKKMQLLSGIHYSHSFDQSFWSALRKEVKSKKNLQDFISEGYLSLTRNFLRMGWLSSYLFGASPALDRSYFNEIELPIEKLFKRSAYAPFATSVRMSHLGYFSKIQSQLGISFNSLREYLRDLKFAINTPHPFYEKIGFMHCGRKVQINENFLQIEAEHYSRIRPKAYSHLQERPIEALREGVGYFEVRNIDINPCYPIGLNIEMLHFLQIFFVYCLIKKSPPIDKEQAKIICMNQDDVALWGRGNNLRLIDDISQKSIALKDWAAQMLDEMAPIAKLLDGKTKKYSSALIRQVQKVLEPNLTPSAKILSEMQTQNLECSEYILKKAKANKRELEKIELPVKRKSELTFLSTESIKKLEAQELLEEDFLPGYEDLEFSTQVLFREALLRSYHVDIIDRKENILKISNGKKEVLVKQATQTEKDSLISFLAMENKHVTQKILSQKGLSTPNGRLFNNTECAIKSYHMYIKQKVVLKPNKANFGEGIVFIGPRSKKAFVKAAEQIEKRGDQILIEPFFEAEEYRFLVIGKKVVAVAQRIPPYVLGNGKSSLVELITFKNKKNVARQSFQKPIEVTVSLKRDLIKKGFSLIDIPKKNQKIYLRQNSNVSTGGESKDVTDQMPTSYKKIALKAVRAIGANICGVDIMIKDLQEGPNPSNHIILELNHNPALFIHRAPSYGKKRYVEKDLLDFLFR